MPPMSWENAEQARAALTAIVSDPEYGVAALSSPRTMSNLLKDLLPDAPREKTVLVAAAEAGLADTLRDHVAQGVDTHTAIRLTASSFSANTSFTPEACSWVAGEFAVALGISEVGQVGTPIQVGPGGGVGYPQVQAPAQPQADAPPVGFGSYSPAPAQFPPGPGSFPPGPAQFPPGPGSFPPGPIQSPGPGSFAPGPGSFPPGPGSFPPGLGQPGTFSPQFGPMAPRGPAKNNNLAIAALICGVAQFVLWIVIVPGVISAALALAFGLVSLRQIQRTREGGRGMAIAGVVLGGLGVLGGIIVLLVVIAATVGSHSTH